MRVTVRNAVLALGCVAHVGFAMLCAAELLEWDTESVVEMYGNRWGLYSFCIAGLLSLIALIAAAWPLAAGRLVYALLVPFLWAFYAFWAWIAPIPKFHPFNYLWPTVGGLVLFGLPLACIWSLGGRRGPQVPTPLRGPVLFAIMALASALIMGAHRLTMDDFQAGVHFVRKGERAFHRSQWKAAERSLTKAIPRLPDYEYPLTLRGRVRVETGNIEGALEDFREASTHDTTGEAQLLLGITLSLAGDWDGARQAYETAIRLGGESEHGQGARQRLGALNTQMRDRGEPSGPRYGPRVGTVPSSSAPPPVSTAPPAFAPPAVR